MRTRVFIFALACLLPVAARASDDDGEPEAKVTTKSCRLDKRHTGKLKISVGPESCGSGGCGTRTTITVHNPDGDRLLTLTNDEGDFAGDGIAVEARCRAGFVEVYAGNPPDEIMLQLRFDPATGRLRRDGPAPEADGWKQPPLAGPAAKRREDMAWLIDAILSGGESDDPRAHRPDGGWVFNDVAGVDRTLRDGIWALVGRDQVEAGEWDSAKVTLERAEETRGTSDNPLSAAAARTVKRRIAEVRKLLAEARRRTMPLKVVERRRIGTTREVQKLPLDPGEPATTFWRNDELCVIQEESPPVNMRCYAPAAKRWGPAVPIQPPAGDGRALKQVQAMGHHVERCNGTYQVTMVLPRDVPDDKANPCLDDGGVELASVLAIVEGGKILTRGGQLGFSVTRGRTSAGADVDPKGAAALVRQSAGTLLVGDGCCVLGRGAVLARLHGDGPQKTWDLRGPPPKDETWADPPLASPDQRWVLAQSTKAGRVTLWLYRVEPAAAVNP